MVSRRSFLKALGCAVLSISLGIDSIKPMVLKEKTDDNSTIYHLESKPLASSALAKLNGKTQVKGKDYQLVGNMITFHNAPSRSDTIGVFQHQ